MRSPHLRAVLVGNAVLLVALATATLQAQSSPQQQRKPVAEVTIRGCMQPGAERTTLTDSTGTTYLLRQSQVSYDHRAFVEVRGQQLSPPGRHGEAALPEIRVVSMRTLKNICPQKLMPPPPNSNPPPRSEQSPATPPYQSPNAPQPQQGGPVLNTPGNGGAPSPGTGNTQDQQHPPK